MTRRFPVAVAGLGEMGAGIAAALIEAGFDVTVWNRTPQKAKPLADRGAVVRDSPAAAAAGARAVLLCLADEAAVEQVLFGGLADALRPGQTVVNAATVSPGFARSVAERLADRGIGRVEACLVGNPRMAREGMLRVFTAGPERDVAAVREVIDAIAQDVRHLGEPGAASALKLAFNLLLGVQVAGLAEAVAFAESAGLDRGLVLETLGATAWGAHVLTFRADFMRRRRYLPAAFRSALMHKDLRLAIETSAALGRRLPQAERAAEGYAAAMAAGRGDEDAAVLVELSAAAPGDERRPDEDGR